MTLDCGRRDAMAGAGVRSLGLIFVVFADLCIGQGAPPTVEPRPAVLIHHESLGRRSLDRESIHSVVWNNHGPNAFDVRRITTSCDCVQVLAYPAHTPPGSTLDLRLRIAPDAPGDFLYSVVIEGEENQAMLLARFEVTVAEVIKEQASSVLDRQALLIRPDEVTKAAPTGEVPLVTPLTRATTNTSCLPALRLPAEASAQAGAPSPVGRERDGVRVQPDSSEGWMIVDVRPRERFLLGHIPGALNLSLRELRLRTFLRSRALLIVADGHDTGCVLDECALLAAAGFTRLRVLDGGLWAWQRSGRELAGMAPQSTRLFALAPAEALPLLGRTNVLWVSIVCPDELGPAEPSASEPRSPSPVPHGETPSPVGRERDGVRGSPELTAPSPSPVPHGETPSPIGWERAGVRGSSELTAPSPSPVPHGGTPSPIGWERDGVRGLYSVSGNYIERSSPIQLPSVHQSTISGLPELLGELQARAAHPECIVVSSDNAANDNEVGLLIGAYVDTPVLFVRGGDAALAEAITMEARLAHRQTVQMVSGRQTDTVRVGGVGRARGCCGRTN